MRHFYIKNNHGRPNFRCLIGKKCAGFYKPQDSMQQIAKPAPCWQGEILRTKKQYVKIKLDN